MVVPLVQAATLSITHHAIFATPDTQIVSPALQLNA